MADIKWQGNEGGRFRGLYRPHFERYSVQHAVFNMSLILWDENASGLRAMVLAIATLRVF